jgi:hypothetical protein
MIYLDIAVPFAASSRASATEFAKHGGGRVIDTPTELDGVEAYRVVVNDPARRDDSPRDAIVCVRDGRMYLLMAFGIGNLDVEPALESVRHSFKWRTPVAALDATQVTWGYATAGTSGVEMAVPTDACRYPIPEAKQNSVIDISLYDYAAQTQRFIAYLQIIPIAPGNTFETTVQRYIEGMNTQKGSEPPLELQALNGDATRLISNVTRMTKLSGDQGKAKALWSLVKIDGQRVALVNFMMPQQLDAAEMTKRMAIIERMIGSIRIDPEFAAATTRPATK